MLARNGNGVRGFRALWPGCRYHLWRRLLSRINPSHGAALQFRDLVSRLCCPAHRRVVFWLAWRSQRPKGRHDLHHYSDGCFYNLYRLNPGLRLYWRMGACLPGSAALYAGVRRGCGVIGRHGDAGRICADRAPRTGLFCDRAGFQ